MKFTHYILSVFQKDKRSDTVSDMTHNNIVKIKELVEIAHLLIRWSRWANKFHNWSYNS